MSQNVDAVKTFKLAIDMGDAFIWRETEEGFDFWMNVTNKLRALAMRTAQMETQCPTK
jgi:hypothetical protein